MPERGDIRSVNRSPQSCGAVSGSVPCRFICATSNFNELSGRSCRIFPSAIKLRFHLPLNPQHLLFARRDPRLVTAMAIATSPLAYKIHMTNTQCRRVEDSESYG